MEHEKRSAVPMGTSHLHRTVQGARLVPYLAPPTRPCRPRKLLRSEEYRSFSKSKTEKPLPLVPSQSCRPVTRAPARERIRAVPCRSCRPAQPQIQRPTQDGPVRPRARHLDRRRPQSPRRVPPRDNPYHRGNQITFPPRIKTRLLPRDRPLKSHLRPRRRLPTAPPRNPIAVDGGSFQSRHHGRPFVQVCRQRHAATELQVPGSFCGRRLLGTSRGFCLFG
jgi:hypothetical protein